MQLKTHLHSRVQRAEKPPCGVVVHGASRASEVVVVVVGDRATDRNSGPRCRNAKRDSYWRAERTSNVLGVQPPNAQSGPRSHLY